MKAVIYQSSATETYGAADATLPKPVLKAGQVLIKIKAAALNPVDYKLPSLPVVGRFIQGRPVCLDLAGVVSEVGTGVTTLKVGDEVFGNSQGGTLAEYVATEASKVALKPKNATFEEAAGLTTTGLTSLQGLVKGSVGEGKRVLIIGASGGCGGLGVQIAKAMKAHVTGVASGKNAELVKSFGADVVHDYNNGDPPREPLYDCIYDTVTSPEDKNYKPLAQTHLAPGGHYVQINGFVTDWLKYFASKVSYGFISSNLLTTNHDSNDLARLCAWVESGQLKPAVPQLFPFSAAGWHDAVALLKGRRVTGKLVFKVEE